ncbi:MAG: hypothetical protein ACLTMF_07190 [Alistipes putredinis]
MKSIYKILLLFACSCGVSCGGDDEPAMTALAVQGIRAEAFPGAIRLTWNPVENSDFLYTEVSYYDFGTQTTVSKQCSRYTGTPTLTTAEQIWEVPFHIYGLRCKRNARATRLYRTAV